MKNLDLLSCNVTELQSDELRETNGGIVGGIILLGALCFFLGVALYTIFPDLVETEE